MPIGIAVIERLALRRRYGTGALYRVPIVQEGMTPGLEGLPFGLRRKHVAGVEDAKSVEVRKRRLDRLVAILRT